MAPGLTSGDFREEEHPLVNKVATISADNIAYQVLHYKDKKQIWVTIYELGQKLEL